MQQLQKTFREISSQEAPEKIQEILSMFEIPCTGINTIPCNEKGEMLFVIQTSTNKARGYVKLPPMPSDPHKVAGYMASIPFYYPQLFGEKGEYARLEIRRFFDGVLDRARRITKPQFEETFAEEMKLCDLSTFHERKIYSESNKFNYCIHSSSPQKMNSEILPQYLKKESKSLGMTWR